MQPHESGALFGHAQRDAQRERAPRQAARGDYPSTTLPGAVFWIVEQYICLRGNKKRVFVLILMLLKSFVFGCCAPIHRKLALLRSQTQ